MTFNDLEKKAKNIISSVLNVSEEEITLNSKFTDDLGADSLDIVELMMYTERELDVHIPDELAEQMGPTLGDAFEKFIKNAPRSFLKNISSRVLSFRFLPDGNIQASLKFEDGSWCYADGNTLLPSTISLLKFSKWSNILKELEEIINDPSSLEADLQYFFESYPELLAGNDYDVVLPQAVIEKEDDTKWKPDFVLTPKNQREFAKVIDLKIPTIDIHKRPKSGHLNFTAKLWDSIMQVRDYYKEFDQTIIREKFRQKYNVDIYKPDLHLIAGRKWDILLLDKMRELQREHNVKIEDWDSVLDRLKRNFTE